MVARKLHNLQYLRAVAAVSAVVFHADITMPLANRGSHFPFSAGIGLGIFFIISGFIMAYTGAEEFGKPAGWWRFARRRLARIVPLYWALTLLTFLVKLLLRGNVSFADLVRSLLFIPFKGSEGILPILTVGWTLNYEMFFYTAFTLCLLLPRKIGLWAVTAILASFAALAYAPFLPEHGVALRFFAATELLEFVAGMGLGWLCLNHVELPFKFSAGAVAGTAIVSAAAMFSLSAFFQLPGRLNDGFYYASAFIPVAIAVLGADLAPKNWLTRGLEKLGDVSYSLYLGHPFVCFVLGVIVVKAGFTGMPVWLYFLVATTLSCAAALVINAIIEKPLSRWAAAALKALSSKFENGRRAVDLPLGASSPPL